LSRQDLPIQRRQSTPLPAAHLHKIFGQTRGASPDDSIRVAKTVKHSNRTSGQMSRQARSLRPWPAERGVHKPLQALLHYAPRKARARISA
jgi:hypothetical protein